MKEASILNYRKLRKQKGKAWLLDLDFEARNNSLHQQVIVFWIETLLSLFTFVSQWSYSY